MLKKRSEEQSRAREYILTEIIELCISEPRKEVGEFAPKIQQIKIDPSKIGDVVGQKGKVINQIIDETGVKIDITDDGAVSICDVDKVGIQKAIDMITMIVSDFEEGRIYQVRLSASRNSVHSLNLHLAKRVWFISPSLTKARKSRRRCTDTWRCHQS